MTVPPLRSITAVLETARLGYWEQPRAALELAAACREQASMLQVPELEARAIALEAAISLHRGDIGGAFALAAEAESLAGEDLHAHAELASLYTHLHFFSGSYADSLAAATRAVELADRTGEDRLRLHARRMGCVAFGNIGVDDLGERFAEVLTLARELDSPWEEIIALNDLGHFHMADGDPGAAEADLADGLRIAATLEHSTFATALLHATRSELRLSTGRAEEAVADGRRAVALAAELGEDVNPYLLGMAVVGLVQALLALGRVEDASAAGDAALERLGDRVPQARSMILSAVAEALREAGRPEDAYDALARGAELERQALREFAQLQRGLERARAENAKLEALVEELAEAHAELHRRSEQLEQLQDQLRDQADRDWLTGLHNRRYLAREGMPGGAVSLAVLDLDHFKAINDRFGHLVGDQVLVRVADLLVENVRGEDVVVRTGGEEFAIVMPQARQEEAVRCCERLCSVIASEPWERLARGLRVTASIGVASTSEGRDFGELERIADERLYAAKRAGRDRVVHGRAAA